MIRDMSVTAEARQRPSWVSLKVGDACMEPRQGFREVVSVHKAHQMAPSGRSPQCCLPFQDIQKPGPMACELRELSPVLLQKGALKAHKGSQTHLQNCAHRIREDLGKPQTLGGDRRHDTGDAGGKTLEHLTLDSGPEPQRRHGQADAGEQLGEIGDVAERMHARTRKALQLLRQT